MTSAQEWIEASNDSIDKLYSARNDDRSFWSDVAQSQALLAIAAAILEARGNS